MELAGGAEFEEGGEAVGGGAVVEEEGEVGGAGGGAVLKGDGFGAVAGHAGEVGAAVVGGVVHVEAVGLEAAGAGIEVDEVLVGVGWDAEVGEADVEGGGVAVHVEGGLSELAAEAGTATGEGVGVGGAVLVGGDGSVEGGTEGGGVDAVVNEGGGGGKGEGEVKGDEEVKDGGWAMGHACSLARALRGTYTKGRAGYIFDETGKEGGRWYPMKGGDEERLAGDVRVGYVRGGWCRNERLFHP